MLGQLRIQNYAIIDQLEIDFSKGLSVITGETGAGKSIIIGALGLILGDRADSSVLTNKEKKSVIEAVFNQTEPAVLDWLRDSELDIADEIIIRREIAMNGKSRAFINDTPVMLNQLHSFGMLLVDLHRQFDTLSVNDAQYQLGILDAYADTLDLLKAYKQEFYQWQQLVTSSKNLKEQQAQLQKDADYNRFQFEELEEAGFTENELEEKETAMKMAEHAEEVNTIVAAVTNTLLENESPVVQQLRIVIQQLNTIKEYLPEMGSLIDRLQQSSIEVQDIAEEINKVSANVSHDPEKLEQLSERLSLGYRLQKKHGVHSTAELLAIQNELSEKLQSVANLDEEVERLEKQIQLQEKKVMEIAHSISGLRKKQITSLEKKINMLLEQVGMAKARLKINIEPRSTPDTTGIDQVDFLFNANLTAEKSNQLNFHPLRKVASGGELSRLILCIKSVIARKINLPTMIFDEIDTGISGEAARQVGIILSGLAKERQVFVITHQPQIAGMADAHFFVYKSEKQNRITTQIRMLDKEERILTIAQMMSGEKPSAAALENAREMVMH